MNNKIIPGMLCVIDHYTDISFILYQLERIGGRYEVFATRGPWTGCHVYYLPNDHIKFSE